VYTITPDATVDEVVQELVRHNVGSLIVSAPGNDKSMVGIVTERDILRSQAQDRTLHVDMLELENHYMKSYIQGEGAEVGTPAS
jgi:CBS domain-containing protein